MIHDMGRSVGLNECSIAHPLSSMRRLQPTNLDWSHAAKYSTQVSTKLLTGERFGDSTRAYDMKAGTRIRVEVMARLDP